MTTRPVANAALLSSALGSAAASRRTKLLGLSLHVHVGELSAVSTWLGDEAGRELLGLNPQVDQPQDRSAFFDQTVADRRLVIRLRASRLYGTAMDIPPAGAD